MSYKGKFRPKNPSKYHGDTNDIVYRSLWERNTFRWCDERPEVETWTSESVVIPYYCPTDRKMHRYYVDLLIRFTNGTTILVEIKPHKQTIEPTPPQKRTRRYIAECYTWAKNQAKWDAAEEWAKDRGIEFHIWTEKSLATLGISVLR